MKKKTKTEDPTYYRTIVNSKPWKEWTKYQEKKMDFDIWESIECGWLSEKHFLAFLEWYKDKDLREIEENGVSEFFTRKPKVLIKWARSEIKQYEALIKFLTEK